MVNFRYVFCFLRVPFHLPSLALHSFFGALVCYHVPFVQQSRPRVLRLDHVHEVGIQSPAVEQLVLPELRVERRNKGSDAVGGMAIHPHMNTATYRRERSQRFLVKLLGAEVRLWEVRRRSGQPGVRRKERVRARTDTKGHTLTPSTTFRMT